MRIAILLTCYNRVHTTLHCLRNVFACERPANLSFDIWLVDDGSRDGTGDAVIAEGARQQAEGWTGEMHVLCGSGQLFWCGGMRLAWQAASAQYDYDGYIWLNDDTFLFPNAFFLLMQSGENICVGAVCNAAKDQVTYGGRDRDGRLIAPNGTLQEAWTLNGNCVYVPQNVFRKIGNFSDYFTHALGDFDYGLRARKAGFTIKVSAHHIGVCENKNPLVVWIDPSVPLSQRIRGLYSAKGSATPRIYFRFNKFHDGWWSAIRQWLMQHIRVCFPALWRLKTEK